MAETFPLQRRFYDLGADVFRYFLMDWRLFVPHAKAPFALRPDSSRVDDTVDASARAHACDLPWLRGKRRDPTAADHGRHGDSVDVGAPDASTRQQYRRPR